MKERQVWGNRFFISHLFWLLFNRSGYNEVLSVLDEALFSCWKSFVVDSWKNRTDLTFPQVWYFSLRIFLLMSNPTGTTTVKLDLRYYNSKRRKTLFLVNHILARITSSTMHQSSRWITHICYKQCYLLVRQTRFCEFATQIKITPIKERKRCPRSLDASNTWLTSQSSLPEELSRWRERIWRRGLKWQDGANMGFHLRVCPGLIAWVLWSKWREWCTF